MIERPLDLDRVRAALKRSRMAALIGRARSEADSLAWRRSFVQSFLERDLAQLGVQVPAVALRRFWNMVAHYHGQIWNAAELAHLDRLEDARNAMRQYVAARPNGGLARLNRHRQWRVAADYDYVLEGARLAGLPE